MDLIKQYKDLSSADKKLLYINNVHPILNLDALFADGTDFYRSYTKTKRGYRVRLRFRTGRDNVDGVSLVIDGQHMLMKRKFWDRMFDYYEIHLDYPACGERYHFETSSGKMTAYYNKYGAVKELKEFYNFCLRPDFQTPDWAKGAVFYQIFVDRFCNGDKTNDVMDREYAYLNAYPEAETNWDAYPKAFDVSRFYGGDLQGVMDKLDYLQSLGVEVLYLNPIFVSPSNHKYDIQDYDYVDPHFGCIVKDEGEVLPEGNMNNQEASRYIARTTDKANLEASNELFAKLVEKIHSRGMKIILDGVFNHCGSFNKWLDRERIYERQEGYEKGAFIENSSPYHSYFRFNGEQWPYNAQYEGWWGHDTLPKLNYEESSQLYQYILHIGKKWVSPPYNVDGWRLDVAADLGHSAEFNHQFWTDFREAVKSANPEALILAEHYGDPAAWMDGNQWDSVMNYDSFMEPVTWFLTGMEKHSDEYRGDLLDNEGSFRGAMLHHMSRMHFESVQVAMNELSNHDHSRFLTRTNRKVGRLATAGGDSASQDVNPAVMREGVVMQMTWPGAPTVYYGDEAGVCGWTDPDNRRTYPWGHENQEFIRFHKDIIRIHKESSALRTGSIKYLYGENGVIAYGRFDQNERYVIVINNLCELKEVDIPVWQIGTLHGSRVEQLLKSNEETYTTEVMSMAVKNGFVHLSMPRTSAIILREVTE